MIGNILLFLTIFKIGGDEVKKPKKLATSLHLFGSKWATMSWVGSVLLCLISPGAEQLFLRAIHFAELYSLLCYFLPLFHMSSAIFVTSRVFQIN